MDKPKAITAAAHKLARIIYVTLTQGQASIDAGQDDYEQRYQQRVLANLKRGAQQLGFELQPRLQVLDGSHVYSSGVSYVS